MQPLVLHPPSLTTAQFGQSRFNSGPERLPLNRPWPFNARGCSPQATPARQSMSGSPPTEEPVVTSEDSTSRGYPKASSPVVTSAEEASVSHIHGRPQFPAPITESLPAPILARYGEQPTPVYAAPPRLPAAPAPYPLSTLDPGLSGPGTRSLAQKTTRRTKAHVASACVNCKKKHLGCDPARPCRRCVLAGKASSCVDVTHKKRGRPPLKAEDSSLRSYSSHPDHSAMSAESQPSVPPHRSALHRPSSSRELRPMTDLQAISLPGSATTMRPSRGPQQRWSASVFPLTRPMDPTLTIPNAGGRRPFSSSGPPSYPPPAHAPPAFIPTTSGFNPVLKTGATPASMDKSFASYANPALPPPTSPQHHHPPGVPFLPYGASPSSSSIHHHLRVDPRIPPRLNREPYPESPVRLPPIHQATASPGPPIPPPGPPPPGVPHHAHRLSDPYPTTWSMARDNFSRDHRTPISPQRGVGSMFSHSSHSHHQRSSSSTSGPFNPVPRHLGPIDLSSAVSLGPSPQLTRAAPPTSEPETHSQTESESRPIKRRKMALDDMVNG
ncbi:hypothetical protein N7478_012910 [Penicillium angulare]|uniref:uncharacterized protein n=1 Tax=Penicillium angulare TaxID=116970 RepID=UPI0025409955|nr:uncharacterized protein N7478_012910 [Penicillium angulare]KAJ5256806.1 hypothetical protein N7478_012910 [Penicillium angulare]